MSTVLKVDECFEIAIEAERHRFERAATLLRDLGTGGFQEFLTTAAYKEFA